MRQEAPSVFTELKIFPSRKNVSKLKDLNYFAIKEAYFQTSPIPSAGCCVGCVKGLLKKGTQLSKILKPVLLENIYSQPSPLNIFPSSSLDKKKKRVGYRRDHFDALGLSKSPGTDSQVFPFFPSDWLLPCILCSTSTPAAPRAPRLQPAGVDGAARPDSAS